MGRRMGEIEGKLCASDGLDLPCGFVEVISTVMHQRNVGLRHVAAQSGLSKSRLGNLLHRDPDKRSEMSLAELQAILGALDLGLLQAVTFVEALHEGRLRQPARFAPLIPMLCAMFHHLPSRLMQALEDVDDMDGTEVRPEWAAALQRAVIKRVVHEINAVTSRRAALSDFSIFS